MLFRVEVTEAEGTKKTITVKVDNWPGDEKDPAAPQALFQRIEDELATRGYDNPQVQTYVIKAGSYDNGNGNGNNSGASGGIFLSDGSLVAENDIQGSWFADSWGSNSFNKADVTIDFNSLPAAPVAIDLDGDGVEYLSLEQGVAFEDQASGETTNTAWVAPDDGLLVIDANDSGTVDTTSEYVFTEWSDDAQTDLEAIAEVFDTNQDGVLDAQDERFDQFAIWQDKDSDGITDEGELVPLTDLGVESIDLTYREDSESRIDGDGDVAVHGQVNVHYEDGTTSTAEDVSFAIEPGDLISEEDDLQVLLSDGEIETPDSPTGDNTIESVVLEENYRLNFDDGDSGEHFD